MKRDIDFTKFFCVNPECSAYGQSESENIVYRSMTGKDKHIMRLKCTCCGKEFSERNCTVLEGSHLSVEKVMQIMRCFRWGVPREGISEICEVNIKTVDHYIDKAGKQAQNWHDQKVVDIEEPVQADEAHGKISGQKPQWIGAAISCYSLLIVAMAFGKRDGSLADLLIARVLAACKKVPMFLTDGWAPYASSICRMLGHLYTPFRKRVDRLRCRGVLLAQVVKRRDSKGKLQDVTMRAVLGGVEKCCRYFKLYGLGNMIHTIHIERWFGPLRSFVRCFQRRTRFLPKLTKRQEHAAWIYTHFYNWLIPHTTLCKKFKKICTPAMAANLLDRPLDYYQWICTPVLKPAKRREEKWLEIANDPQRIKAYERSPISRGKIIFKTDMEQIAC